MRSLVRKLKWSMWDPIAVPLTPLHITTPLSLTIPDWAEKQIYNDLRSTEISNPDTLYTICNGKVSASATFHPRQKRMLQLLRLLAKHTPLPDCIIPVCHEDECTANFGISKAKRNGGILFPDPEYLHKPSPISVTIPWSEKKEIAFWRGTTTGKAQRSDVVAESDGILINAAFSSTCQGISNVKLAPPLSPNKQLVYKYLLAIEGNVYPSSLEWQLASNSALLFKNSDYVAWYYSALTPYVNYIPFSDDLPNVVEWCKSHDREVEEIALTGALFAKAHLTVEAKLAYWYHLICAFSETYVSNSSLNLLVENCFA